MNYDSQEDSNIDPGLSLKDTVNFIGDIISAVAEEDWEVLKEGKREIISAKILNSTHLELSQPISAEPGKRIQISIIDEGNEDSMRRDVSKKKFFESYDIGDSIYDHPNNNSRGK